MILTLINMILKSMQKKKQIYVYHIDNSNSEEKKELMSKEILKLDINHNLIEYKSCVFIMKIFLI